MKKISVTLLLKNGKRKVYSSTDNITRILQNISLRDLTKGTVYCSYGKKKCTLGCVCLFDNQGTYTDKKELVNAIRAFWNA